MNNGDLHDKFHLDGISPAPRGVPQIEVTSNIDTSRIMNVSAQDTRALAKRVGWPLHGLSVWRRSVTLQVPRSGQDARLQR